MADDRYSMSFTSGALLRHESLLVAEYYQDLGDWNVVRTHVVGDNLLQMRTLNASKRIYREVSSRLSELSPSQLELLLATDLQQQKYLLWLAYCRRYRFIHDFATEVVREKYIRLDSTLTYDDFDLFFQKKAEWHPEVAAVATTTFRKQRQVVFKTMREAELLTSTNQIVPVFLTPLLTDSIFQNDPRDLAIFPTAEAFPRSDMS